MLIINDLTKSSRRQSLQVEKCTSNDPQPMMAVDGRGEDGNDGNDPQPMMAIDGRGEVDVS